MASIWQRETVRRFRLHGLQPQRDAVSAVLAEIAAAQAAMDEKEVSYAAYAVGERENPLIMDDGELGSKVLAGVISAVKKAVARGGMGSTNIVSGEMVLKCIESLHEAKSEEVLGKSSRCTVLNAFETPMVIYDPTTMLLNMEVQRVKGKESRSLHPPPSAKGQMLRDRLLLVQQRLMRHPNFIPPLLASSRREYAKITHISSLLGNHGTRLLVGIISQPKEAEYHIEDLTGSIRLDLSETDHTDGLVTENSIVMALGEMSDNLLFRVKKMALPLPEDREVTRQALAADDLYCFSHSKEQLARLELMGKKAVNDEVVFISDLHVDQPTVLAKLKTLMKGMSESTKSPIFVFMGNFTSIPMGHGARGIERVKSGFADLADVITSVPRLAENAQFVFVPGPNDPGAGGALPQQPLPSCMTGPLKEKIRHVSFGTNPCRLRMYTQEICVFREDLTRKMQRHCIIPPNDSKDVTEQLALTLVRQGHMCPLPLTTRPIYWQFDHSLSLYPMPHALVLGDHTEQFNWDLYGQCKVINPGPFPSESAFAVYLPASQTTEFGRIPE